LRLDYEFARGEAKVITGDPGFILDDRLRIGELDLEFLHDGLDNMWFPNSGTLHRLTYRYAADELGATFDYRQASADGTMAFSREKNIFSFNYEIGYSFDDKAPFERWYRLGGLGRLSRLAPDQLSGRHIGFASLTYRRRLNNLDLFKTYAGVSLEAGNVWNFGNEMRFDDLRYSGSLFVGVDSPIGPVYFAVGHSDNGDNAVYFYVGDPFGATRFD
jgi:NTE family protein